MARTINAKIQNAGWKYAYTTGQSLTHYTDSHYSKVNEERAREIAVAYENLPEYDDSVEVLSAYAALTEETLAQYHYCIDVLGITFEHTSEDPYANSEDMLADLATGHLRVYRSEEEFHPYWTEVLITTPDGIALTGNDLLRAVHDVFGHGACGFGFGARGELNAFIHHSMMFSPTAQLALTTETNGQNCWVNFYGDHESMSASERPYAQQKVALLPYEYTKWIELL